VYVSAPPLLYRNVLHIKILTPTSIGEDKVAMTSGARDAVDEQASVSHKTDGGFFGTHIA
jgi:hypothetical protein